VLNFDLWGVWWVYSGRVVVAVVAALKCMLLGGDAAWNWAKFSVSCVVADQCSKLET
jgi:hypothetical protein